MKGDEDLQSIVRIPKRQISDLGHRNKSNTDINYVEDRLPQGPQGLKLNVHKTEIDPAVNQL